MQSELESPAESELGGDVKTAFAFVQNTERLAAHRHVDDLNDILDSDVVSGTKPTIRVDF